jgi:hypothetical protein
MAEEKIVLLRESKGYQWKAENVPNQVCPDRTCEKDLKAAKFLLDFSSA